MARACSVTLTVQGTLSGTRFWVAFILL
jgi:hypothetical protein